MDTLPPRSQLRLRVSLTVAVILVAGVVWLSTCPMKPLIWLPAASYSAIMPLPSGEMVSSASPIPLKVILVT